MEPNENAVCPCCGAKNKDYDAPHIKCCECDEVFDNINYLDEDSDLNTK